VLAGSSRIHRPLLQYLEKAHADSQDGDAGNPFFGTSSPDNSPHQRWRPFPSHWATADLGGGGP
jgi:hypothetical protein